MVIQHQQRYEIPERQRLSKSYQIKFTLKYRVPAGQKLYVMGSIAEISEWDKTIPKVQMKQKFQGSDVWQMDKDIVTNKFFFVYKFALYDEDNQFIQYERGVDRICDLELLPNLNDTQPGN